VNKTCCEHFETRSITICLQHYNKLHLNPPPLAAPSHVAAST